MSNGQTSENRPQKRRFSFTGAEEAVSFQAAEKRLFRDMFAANCSQRPQWDSVTMENQRCGTANRNVRLTGRSWVYFAQRGPGGPIKIGRTRQLSSRITALQSVCPEDVALLGKLPETDVTEDAIHNAFRRHRIRGEWFHPAPEILELAAAGGRIYAAGYCQEIPEGMDAEWLVIRRYAVRPRQIGPKSAADLVSDYLVSPNPAQIGFDRKENG